MNKYRYLLFDMDGTIINSSQGILAGVKYAEKNLDLPSLGDKEYSNFLGPPLKQSFIRAYNLSGEDAEAAVAFFRKYYSKDGIFQCVLYPGIVETLQRLQSEGYILFVATSKPTIFAEKIAQQLGIKKYFHQIVGSNLDNSRSTKQEVIQDILNLFPGASFKEFLMIGDKIHDIEGAAQCNINAVAVTYGFGSLTELHGENLIMLIDSIQELSAAL